MSVSGADGYIVYYNGGEAVLIEGQNDYSVCGLNKGKEYNISIYSFSGLPSISASNLNVNFNGKLFALIMIFTVPNFTIKAKPLNITSVMHNLFF